MAEMKKKIQLVEGERKAVYEDCEKEKQENSEKIRSSEREKNIRRSKLYIGAFGPCRGNIGLCRLLSRR